MIHEPYATLNCTGRELTVLLGDGSRCVLPAQEKPVRVVDRTVGGIGMKIGVEAKGIWMVPIRKANDKPVVTNVPQHLPNRRDDAPLAIIVSHPAAEALCMLGYDCNPNYLILTPSQLQRDNNGKVIGCRSFELHSKPVTPEMIRDFEKEIINAD